MNEWIKCSIESLSIYPPIFTQKTLASQFIIWNIYQFHDSYYLYSSRWRIFFDWIDPLHFITSNVCRLDLAKLCVHSHLKVECHCRHDQNLRSEWAVSHEMPLFVPICMALRRAQSNPLRRCMNANMWGYVCTIAKMCVRRHLKNNDDDGYVKLTKTETLRLVLCMHGMILLMGPRWYLWVDSSKFCNQCLYVHSSIFVER